jgi:hypothetical protein
MRRMLLICASAAVLTLPAAAAAAARGHAAPGFLVVRNAAGDGGIYGHPVVTVVVQGFVLGSISTRAEARIDVYQLPSAAGGGTPQARGSDVTTTAVRWRGFHGHRFSGSGFRFRATGGTYRVVVHGSGVYLYAGGHGNVTLRGSSVYPRADGTYSVDGQRFRSLPASPSRRKIGGS